MTDTERDALGHWLAGLVDGEGCFYLSTFRTRGARGYERKYRVLTFEFKIAMRGDDVDVLQQAHAILGVGRIEHRKRGISPTTSQNAKPLAALIVYRRTDLPTVIDFFRRFPLRSKKARDFQVWAEAFERMAAVTHDTPRSADSSRRGDVLRPSKTGKRRPTTDRPRQRFKTIPDTLFHEMHAYAERLRALREYQT